MNKLQQKWNFDRFYNNIPSHKNKQLISSSFLTWFIGFIEADGCFEKDGRINITQSSKDIQVLYYIRTTIGFGKVINQNKNSTHRWRTTLDPKIAGLLAVLFNGNLVTGSKLKKFRAWFEIWAKKSNPEFNNIIGPDFKLQKNPLPQLMRFNNGWLSGFIDGDGCWSISISNSISTKNPSSSIRLQVAAQNDPEWVFNVMNCLNMGRREPKNSSINLKWTVSKYSDIELLINYIEDFPHKTKKFISFSRFCKVRRRILKKEHYGKGFNKMQTLIKSINSDH